MKPLRRWAARYGRSAVSRAWTPQGYSRSQMPEPEGDLLRGLQAEAVGALALAATAHSLATKVSSATVVPFCVLAAWPKLDRASRTAVRAEIHAANGRLGEPMDAFTWRMIANHPDEDLGTARGLDAPHAYSMALCAIRAMAGGVRPGARLPQVDHLAAALRGIAPALDEHMRAMLTGEARHVVDQPVREAIIAAVSVTLADPAVEPNVADKALPLAV